MSKPESQLRRTDAVERGHMKDVGHYTLEFERADLKIRFSAGGAVAIITALTSLGLVAAFVFLKYL